MMMHIKFKLAALFVLINLATAFAQTNPSKDEKKLADVDRQFCSSHKIHEVDEYLLKRESDPPTDSTLFCRMFYDKRGNLIKTIEYHPNAAAQKIPHHMTASLYEYDRKNHLTEKTVTSEDYALIHQVIAKMSDNGIFNKDESYKYKNGDVERRNYQLLMIEDRTIYKRNFTDKYNYDEEDDLLMLATYNDEGKPFTTTRYFYNDRSELIKNTVYSEVIKKTISTTVFNYNHLPVGLLKQMVKYDARDSIVKQNDQEYDLNGNQTKEYETVKMNKRLILDFKYNDKGQPVESKGGPLRMNDIVSKDVRHDGLAHLFYVYDDDGKPTEIKKFEADKLSSEEKLSAVEKLVYKKY